MSSNQKIHGWLNSQKIVNNNIIVDEKYLQKLLKFQNNPSDVNYIVLSLYNSIIEDDKPIGKRNLPPEIEEKMNFNNLIKYRPLVENNFSENGFYLDTAYNSLDSDTPGRKRMLLNYINMVYLEVLGEYIQKESQKSKLEVIRANADNIIVEIINRLLIRVASNADDIEHIPSESLEYNIIAIVCHAFVDCKILETPNN